MTHKEAAKTHFRNRFIERYGTSPSLLEIDLMRRQVKAKKCFMWKTCGHAVKAIVCFRNIHVAVVYDTSIDGMVTAGVKI